MSEHRIQHCYANQCAQENNGYDQNEGIEFLIPVKVHEEHGYQTGFHYSNAYRKNDIVWWRKLQETDANGDDSKDR